MSVESFVPTSTPASIISMSSRWRIVKRRAGDGVAVDVDTVFGVSCFAHDGTCAFSTDSGGDVDFVRAGERIMPTVSADRRLFPKGVRATVLVAWTGRSNFDADAGDDTPSSSFRLAEEGSAHTPSLPLPTEGVIADCAGAVIVMAGGLDERSVFDPDDGVDA